MEHFKSYFVNFSTGVMIEWTHCAKSIKHARRNFLALTKYERRKGDKYILKDYPLANAPTFEEFRHNEKDIQISR